MRRLNTTNKFEKDVELAKRRGKDMTKIRIVIDLLINRQSLLSVISNITFSYLNTIKRISKGY